MKTLFRTITLAIFATVLSVVPVGAQEQENGAMNLDTHLDQIRQVKDVEQRKAMLREHLMMMREKVESMSAMGMMGGGMMGGGMGQGEGGMGGGMGQGEGGMGGGMMGGGMGQGEGGMMQHHTDMINMLNHMISVQEMLLDLVD